ncbi:GumC family protein [Pollutibacter soli]|uniref:GumC family protein n=1 Tax=Pollutibacter soli TaxID=3034157 RepID=UPI003013CAE0
MENGIEHILQDNKINSKITPREFLMRYLHFLPWILLSLAISLTIAFLNLRYSPRIYNVTGNILIKDPNAFGGSGGGKFDDIFFMQPERSLSDEIQIIRSRKMASRVVKSLHMQTIYYVQGKVRSSIIHSSQCPVELEIIYLKDSTKGFNLQIQILDDQQFTFGDLKSPVYFGKAFEVSAGIFKINRKDFPIASYIGPPLIINWQPEEKRAIELLGALKVGLSVDASNILTLSYETQNPRTGVDVVNKFMEEYREAGFEENRLTAKGTLDFINDQLDSVRLRLSQVEGRLMGFREKNRIYNPELQSGIVFSKVTEFETKATENNVRLKVLEYLINYVQDNKNIYKSGLSSLGIEEPTLQYQIGEYNKLQVQRETLLKTTLASNPAVINIETAILKLRNDILSNLQSIRTSALNVQKDLQRQDLRNNSEISTIPQKEKQLLDITRQQKIYEELFSFLLQKKLETSIGSKSTLPNSSVIETAMSSGVPVKPNRKTIYLTAFLLGIAIPGAIIFLIEFLNDKVRIREDIEKGTDAPILGEIGHSKYKESLVVSRNSRKFIAEQFRIIRTNTQYFLPKTSNPIILVTSSFSGEGKSFISVNMGAVMALTGKKTVVLEFDIRKPKISQNLKLKQTTGISNFIIGKAEFRDLPIPVPETENLYIIPCGPIPPNPAELLLSERLQELFAELKKAFDVVIIDTAPVGLVSDAITLGKFADATLYILRHNYTFKKQLKLIDELYHQKRLPNLSLIINDISAQGGYGNYQTYTGYGSGYGQGYGEGYYEVELTEKNWLKKIFSKNKS